MAGIYSELSQRWPKRLTGFPPMIPAYMLSSLFHALKNAVI
ncbi:hypothetical protein RMSM_05905 [Rhodopirellula maiorica SM1]|uniref:Uncharacterized protein n=1 Tax=Rhodopirellula maiorica SM1 TaxID=1265738 RepID=M5RCR3_9BACT|nr:hypothetical protein RMSM_05905 [Rhodopirellula maiorica SM1]